ncbi:hypothetical protein ACOSQ3_005377 [Xanthoceras sorbifolium]
MVGAMRAGRDAGAVHARSGRWGRANWAVCVQGVAVRSWRRWCKWRPTMKWREERGVAVDIPTAASPT